MKLIKIISLLFVVTLCSAKAKQTAPNIILIVTDDQGKNDLACEGNPYVKTPNLDAFYNESVRFTNFHVSTTCAPSRSSIMTGRHTNRLNMFHTIAGRSLLFEDEVLLPEVLVDNGYTTGMFGKWHLGDNYPFRPGDRGFQEVVRHGAGGIGQGPDFWGNDYFDDTYWHNGVTEPYTGYCTDVFFEEAIKFIDKNKENPFFCYISTNAPHGPLNCPEEYIDMYEDTDVADKFKRLYGMITNIDDNFKVLEDKLDELGLTDNTILIFMTDNGTSSGHHVYDAGMKGHKTSEYEGGHRVPFYFRFPAKGYDGGKDIDQLVAHYDMLPTFVEMLDLDFEAKKPLDGKSFAPLLDGKTKAWENRILYMDTQREINLIKYKQYSVMDDEWRLVNGTELYEMKDDLGQTNNVIADHSAKAEELAAGYEVWWQSFLDDDADTRFAYITVGTPHENPSRISAHDMIMTNFGKAWHQHGAVMASPASGSWKINFAESGSYKISLCRFPRESGLEINATFPAQAKERRLDSTMPASVKDNFTKAYLYVANVDAKLPIKAGAKEVTFNVEVTEGKYDMIAQLIDENGVLFPSYYVYIEKIQ